MLSENMQINDIRVADTVIHDNEESKVKEAEHTEYLASPFWLLCKTTLDTLAVMLTEVT